MPARSQRRSTQLVFASSGYRWQVRIVYGFQKIYKVVYDVGRWFLPVAARIFIIIKIRCRKAGIGIKYKTLTYKLNIVISLEVYE